MVFPLDILLWQILPKKVDAQISPCVPSPFKLPCSRIPVPSTNRKPARVVSLQPDLNLKGPLIFPREKCFSIREKNQELASQNVKLP